MCGSTLSVKGGMVSVVKNYLNYNNWNEFEIKYIPTHTDKGKIFEIFYFLVQYIRIFYYVIFRKFDYLYLHTAERGSFYRKAILVHTFKRFNIKTVMHHHAAEFEQFYNGLSEKRKSYINETLQMVDLNIVLSKKLVNMITDKAPNANVKVLYNAVDTFSNNPYNVKAKGILFLGRLGERKGIYDLIDTIAEIDKILPNDIHFYFCGDGEIENVKRAIIKKNISNRIVKVGWINGDEKKRILKDTMINVLPSYNEGLPMTILETMAYGIPNISTNIASIPEVIVNDENGLMIEPGDIEGLCKGIVKLCNDCELRIKMSNNAWRDIKEKFDIDANIKRLIEYLRGL